MLCYRRAVVLELKKQAITIDAQDIESYDGPNKTAIKLWIAFNPVM